MGPCYLRPRVRAVASLTPKMGVFEGGGSIEVLQEQAQERKRQRQRERAYGTQSDETDDELESTRRVGRGGRGGNVEAGAGVVAAPRPGRGRGRGRGSVMQCSLCRRSGGAVLRCGFVSDMMIDASADGRCNAWFHPPCALAAGLRIRRLLSASAATTSGTGGESVLCPLHTPTIDDAPGSSSGDDAGVSGKRARDGNDSAAGVTGNGDVDDHEDDDDEFETGAGAGHRWAHLSAT